MGDPKYFGKMSKSTNSNLENFKELVGATLNIFEKSRCPLLKILTLLIQISKILGFRSSEFNYLGKIRWPLLKIVTLHIEISKILRISYSCHLTDIPLGVIGDEGHASLNPPGVIGDEGHASLNPPGVIGDHGTCLAFRLRTHASSRLEFLLRLQEFT